MDSAAQNALPFEYQASHPVGIYFPCPDCGTYFKDLHGFADHMIFEHWWERDVAELYWSLA